MSSSLGTGFGSTVVLLSRCGAVEVQTVGRDPEAAPGGQLSLAFNSVAAALQQHAADLQTQHNKLTGDEAERMKQYWRAALEQLKPFVETQKWGVRSQTHSPLTV